MGAEVADWKPSGERKVDSGENLHSEEVPAEQTDDPSECSSSMLVGGGVWVAGRDTEERGSEASEGRHKQQEDEEEDQICGESVVVQRK